MIITMTLTNLQSSMMNCQFQSDYGMCNQLGRTCYNDVTRQCMYFDRKCYWAAEIVSLNIHWTFQIVTSPITKIWVTKQGRVEQWHRTAWQTEKLIEVIHGTGMYFAHCHQLCSTNTWEWLRRKVKTANLWPLNECSIRLDLCTVPCIIQLYHKLTFVHTALHSSTVMAELNGNPSADALPSFLS